MNLAKQHNCLIPLVHIARSSRTVALDFIITNLSEDRVLPVSRRY